MKLYKLSILILTAILIASCAPQVSYHGHVFTDDDVQQIKPGMSEAQVKLALGTPATTSTIGGGAFYYISSKQEKKMAFQKGSVVDRRVLAVYFNDNREVDRVINLGIQDGQIVRFNNNTITSYKGGDSIIADIFKGIGRRRLFDQGGGNEDF